MLKIFDAYFNSPLTFIKLISSFSLQEITPLINLNFYLLSQNIPVLSFYTDFLKKRW
jgi:hypothetical protein